MCTYLAGVTLAECKSGYGVDFETEVRMLRVINRALKDPDVKMDISVTYCGAHAIAKYVCVTLLLFLACQREGKLCNTARCALARTGIGSYALFDN